jgi:sortase A
VKIAGTLERSFLVGGVVLLAFYTVARIHGFLLSRVALRELAAVSESVSANPSNNYAKHLAAPPDFALRSERHITAQQHTPMMQFLPALAILRVPKIHLEVPVLEGTDNLTLNRGTGRIAGTAHVGEGGNVGIAGHRDGFFRGLKNVKMGDTIDLVTPKGIENYAVDRILIVNPHDTSVLRRLAAPSLTLVTCYPFYFVGSAPQRYIVQATLTDSSQKITAIKGHSSEDRSRGED